MSSFSVKTLSALLCECKVVYLRSYIVGCVKVAENSLSAEVKEYDTLERTCTQIVQGLLYNKTCILLVAFSAANAL